MFNSAEAMDAMEAIIDNTAVRISCTEERQSLPLAARLDYWRSLLNPTLRDLEVLTANQMEEVQAALRDALHLIEGFRRNVR